MFLPISLEAGVVIIGLFLLLFEAFDDKSDKRQIAWMGIAGLATIPRDLYEAASIDGAGSWGSFRYLSRDRRWQPCRSSRSSATGITSSFRWC